MAEARPPLYECHGQRYVLVRPSDVPELGGPGVKPDQAMESHAHWVDESTIRLCLVHCKGAHGGVISRDIRNFYVVCGQAQKSVVAKHAGLGRLYHDLKRRQDAWLQ